MTPDTLRAFRSELSKTALLERLVRLGATDIPKTPRLFMKQRSPSELAGLQHGVENWWSNKVTNPLMQKAEKHVVSKLPEKIQPVARKGAKLVAEDPIGTALTNAIPIPGAHPAYLGAKKGLEHLIDRVAPLQA